jgi:hypothetical protein
MEEAQSRMTQKRLMQRIGSAILFSLAVLFSVQTVAAKAQKEPSSADCSIEGKRLTCDRIDFLKSFAEARILALESQPKNRIADKQLASLARSLGEQVMTGLPADMTLRLVRPAITGVAIGPHEMELASLRVFSTKAGSEASHLLWVETYRGQADMPWPMVVRALLQQFQATLADH